MHIYFSTCSVVWCVKCGVEAEKLLRHRTEYALQNGTIATAISCTYANIDGDLHLQVDVEDAMSRKGFVQLPLEIAKNAIYRVKLSASNGTLFAEVDVNPPFSRSEWLPNLNVSFGLFHHKTLVSKESTVVLRDIPQEGPKVANCTKFQAVAELQASARMGKSWCVRLRQHGVVVSDLVCSESFHDERVDAGTPVTPPSLVSSQVDAAQPVVVSDPISSAPQLTIAMATSKPLLGGETASGKISLAANCSFFREIQENYPNVFVDVITDGLSDSIAVPVDFDGVSQQCIESQRYQQCAHSHS